MKRKGCWYEIIVLFDCDFDFGVVGLLVCGFVGYESGVWGVVLSVWDWRLVGGL